MFLRLELEARTQCSLPWKHSATPLGRSWWVLSMSELRTKDNESGSWLTPRAIYGEHPGITDLSHLPGQALWKTPKASDSPGSKFRRNSRGELPLPGQVLWSTPKASELDRGVCEAEANRRSPALQTQVLFPTPTATEYGSNQGGAAGRLGEKRLSLQGVVSNSTGNVRARLNPDWVEQLMGFPVGWTNIE